MSSYTATICRDEATIKIGPWEIPCMMEAEVEFDVKKGWRGDGRETPDDPDEVEVTSSVITVTIDSYSADKHNITDGQLVFKGVGYLDDLVGVSDCELRSFSV